MAIKLLTDFDTYFDATGTKQPNAGNKWYAIPSRTDISLLSGSDWIQLSKNEDLPTAYQYGFEAEAAEGTGQFSLPLWFTDTEIDVPNAATLPAVVWNIIQASTGKVFFGPLPSTLGAGPFTLKQLLSLASPDTWQVGGALVQAVTAFETVRGSVAITNGDGDEKAVNFLPPLSTANYIVTFGCETDSAFATYQPNVKDGTRTADGFTIKMAGVVPSGKTVEVFYRAEVL